MLGFMSKSKNKGYERVNKNPRNQGKFVSKNDEPMVSINVRLPRTSLDWVEAQARQRGINRVDVIRELIYQQQAQQIA